LTFAAGEESFPDMKKLFLFLACVAFTSAATFAGDCCSGKKSKEETKGQDSTKQNLTVTAPH
jgi:hypothetical protein